ncbi:hypothetical protein CMUS01_16465 [Colletotrichum musicola]|uniref:Ankyrin repeat protein n=1 Tax=Colletotrichum musicola TaxID=2175873 RepID=A0A8H6MIY5_9PEZI|nr:hypothetical protein CMUS01_16465 [Colletotrichum musicola]
MLNYSFVHSTVPNNNTVAAAALYEASIRGYKDVVQLLLENGICPNKRNPDHKRFITALAGASAGGYTKVVKRLLRYDADRHQTINLVDTKRATALFLASFKGHAKIVRLLLENGADIDIQNNSCKSNTALSAASARGHEDVVRLLIEKDASVNAQSVSQTAPLYCASLNGHKDIVQLLLDAGAELAALNSASRYKTAVSAACSGDHANVLQLLLAQGGDPDSLAGDWDTALFLSVARRHRNCTELLVRHGAKVNTESKTYGLPLILAAFKGDLQAVEVLLENGASIDAKGEWDAWTLAGAGHGTDLRRGKFIFQSKSGRQSDQERRMWGTALTAASAMGYVDIVMLLVARGANAGFAGEQSGNPLQAALISGHRKVVEVLLGKMVDQDPIKRGYSFSTHPGRVSYTLSLEDNSTREN